MPTKQQDRIKKRLDRRQDKVNQSRETFGTNDPDTGRFDRRLNRLKRTVNTAEKQGMNVNYDTRNASGEGVVKTVSPIPNLNKGYGHESVKTERHDLLHDNPVTKDASGGRSWMSKHSKSRLVGSPLHSNSDKKAEYARTIQLAQSQKANPAQVSAKLRDTYPEVGNEEVEVNWSPDGKQVEVHPKQKKNSSRSAR